MFKVAGYYFENVSQEFMRFLNNPRFPVDFFDSSIMKHVMLNNSPTPPERMVDDCKGLPLVTGVPWKGVNVFDRRSLLVGESLRLRLLLGSLPPDPLETKCSVDIEISK